MSSFTKRECKVLKKLIAKEILRKEKKKTLKKEEESESESEWQDNVFAYKKLIASYPRKVVKGGLYPQLDARICVYADRVIVSKYPGAPSGCLWSADSGKPIPSKKVVDRLNEYLKSLRKGG